MKLHLGCGQRYLDGYINIDFPPSAHSVQESSIADIYADILCLSYPPQSVEEVRLHHVFEHFPRPIACALLASWFSWLKPEGIIHIEVPDFQKTAKVMVNPLISFKKQAVAERHLFGSHEAGWAIHCEGYTPRILTVFIEQYGFKLISIKKNHWRGTYNFELIGKKTQHDLSRKDLEKLTQDYLKKFLVDESDGEIKLLTIWMDLYKEQLEKTWARDE